MTIGCVFSTLKRRVVKKVRAESATSIQRGCVSDWSVPTGITVSIHPHTTVTAKSKFFYLLTGSMSEECEARIDHLARIAFDIQALTDRANGRTSSQRRHY